MTDLREKVAEAILLELSKQEMLFADPITLQRLMAKRCADAAIDAVLEALKEPSEEMVAAGLSVPVFSFESGLVDIRPAWAAMLTAFTRGHYLSALAEEDGKLIE